MRTTNAFLPNPLKCCLIGVALLASVQALQAQDALLQNAQSVIAGRQAAQAYQLLSPQETARAG
jgi:hypothetical protein